MAGALGSAGSGRIPSSSPNESAGSGAFRRVDGPSVGATCVGTTTASDPVIDRPGEQPACVPSPAFCGRVPPAISIRLADAGTILTAGAPPTIVRCPTRGRANPEACPSARFVKRGAMGVAAAAVVAITPCSIRTRRSSPSQPVAGQITPRTSRAPATSPVRSRASVAACRKSPAGSQRLPPFHATRSVGTSCAAAGHS